MFMDNRFLLEQAATDLLAVASTLGGGESAQIITTVANNIALVAAELPHPAYALDTVVPSDTYARDRREWPLVLTVEEQKAYPWL